MPQIKRERERETNKRFYLAIGDEERKKKKESHSVQHNTVRFTLNKSANQKLNV